MTRPARTYRPPVQEKFLRWVCAELAEIAALAEAGADDPGSDARAVLAEVARRAARAASDDFIRDRQAEQAAAREARFGQQPT
jgi:hypothetical protein